MRKNRERVLRPTFPNSGLEKLYKQKLVNLITEMANSIDYWLLSAYRKTPPVLALDDKKVSKATADYRDFPSQKEHCKLCTMFIKPNSCTAVRGTIYEWGWCKYFESIKLAQDVSPAQEIRKAFKKLARRWIRNWNTAADKLAKFFALSSKKRTDAQIMVALKKAGIAVEFQTTKAIRDIMHATVNANVNLIRSLPKQYLDKVEILVMQSIQSGGDLKTLSDELQKQFKITKNRAALISRDQNSKAHSAFTRARYLELGYEFAIWRHSLAGNEPRHSHVANNGKRYNVRTGWLDPTEGRRIHPGQLINCRCYNTVVIPGI